MTLAVLAGGASRRMGEDKGLLPLAGKPMAMHVVERLRSVCPEAFVVTNRPAAYLSLRLPLATDRKPDLGPLAGLETALAAARTPLVLVVACDLPLALPALAMHLLEVLDQAEAAVPRWGGRAQPLFAVYRRASLPRVSRALAEGHRRLQDILDALRVRWVSSDEVRGVDPEGHSFLNVNTPAEFRQAEALLARED